MRIYVSSTFEDLKEFRAKVERTLRKLEHVAVCMEDYVATDARPLAKCRADVAACDALLCIVAHRYGFLPEQDNPESRSITELEYREAERLGIPRLAFILRDDVPWHLKFTDSHTKENEAGARVQRFREFLGKERLSGLFTNADDLATEVSAAIQRLAPPVPAPLPAKGAAAAAPEAREIRHAVLLAYDALDEAPATAVAEALAQHGFSARASTAALKAETEAEREALELAARAAHAAVVALGPAGLEALKPRAAAAAFAVDLLRDRCGRVDLLWFGAAPPALPAGLAFDRVIAAGPLALPLAGVEPFFAELERNLPRLGAGRGGRSVGLPFTVLAMTRVEAAELLADPKAAAAQFDGETRARFDALLADLTAAGIAPAAGDYPERRVDWQPFRGLPQTVRAVLESSARELNERFRSRLRDRSIRLQYYPFDCLLAPDRPLRRVYRDIADSGCIVVVDELSLFHPKLCETLARSAFATSPQTALVTLAPLDAARGRAVEAELEENLRDAFDRFASDFDPQCEFGVGNERRLRRWLHASLPQALNGLREPPPDRGALDAFAKEVGRERRGFTEILYAPGEGP